MQHNGSATSSKPGTSRQATLTSEASLTCERTISEVLGELARVTKTGGKIGLLHEFIPPTKRLPVKLLGVVGVMNGPQKRIRLFAIYRKTEQQMAFLHEEQQP